MDTVKQKNAAKRMKEAEERRQLLENRKKNHGDVGCGALENRGDVGRVVLKRFSRRRSTRARRHW